MAKKGRGKFRIHKKCQCKVVLQNGIGTMLPVFRPAPWAVSLEKAGRLLINPKPQSQWMGLRTTVMPLELTQGILNPRMA